MFNGVLDAQELGFLHFTSFLTRITEMHDDKRYSILIFRFEKFIYQVIFE